MSKCQPNQDAQPAAVFTGQKPPGSAGGLKPTSRLPSVGFEMWQTLRMAIQAVGEWVRRMDAVVKERAVLLMVSPCR